MNGRGNRSTRRKPAPAPLCPPQIPIDQTRDWTRAAVVGSQQLTASAMARPCTSLTLQQMPLVHPHTCNPSFWNLFENFLHAHSATFKPYLKVVHCSTCFDRHWFSSGVLKIVRGNCCAPWNTRARRWDFFFFFFFSFYSCCSHLEHRPSVKHFVSLQFLNLRESVGLLGRGIRASQGHYLHRTTQTHKKRKHIYALSGIRANDPSVRGGEHIS
jgi:hypothetical protein